MKILAADDQPLILKSIGHKLKASGFEIVFAENGKEAIQQYNEHHPDLVIVDLNMPILSGFEVIHYIREIKKDSTPIIVMSGNDEEDIIVDTFKLGVDDYIEKPVGLNEVLVRVKRLLKQPLSKSDFKQTDEESARRTLQKKCVGVVIPCYNEETRLLAKEFTDFAFANLGYHLCFVNDGSKDKTLEVLQNLCKGREDYISVYNCEVNGGKAEAVRLGVLHLSKDPQLDYIGYLDADLSTDFADFEDLVKTIETSELITGQNCFMWV